MSNGTKKTIARNCAIMLVPLVVGFGATVGAVTFQADVPGVNGFSKVDKISWNDSKGLLREAYFAKEYTGLDKAKGYITRFVYRTQAGDSVTCNESSAADSQSGLGTSINFQGQWTETKVCQKKDGTNFSQQVLFQGDNHLIYKTGFTQPSGSGSYAVTVNWCFYEGIDYFLYAITYLPSAGFTSNDDARGPFCDFNWDGYGDTRNHITGVSWGTDKLFVCPQIDSVTLANTIYTYGAANLVPFTQEWLLAPSREMGMVQTQMQTAHAGGCYTSNWLHTGTMAFSAATSAWFDYPFYNNSMENWTGNCISWAVSTGSINPRQCYTVAIQIGEYASHGVDSLLRETERVLTKTTMSATTGTVVTSGPIGSGYTGTTNYSPAGFDQVYRVWRARAATGSAVLGFNISSGAVQNPCFVIGNVTGQVSGVSLNSTALTAGTGYVASFDAAKGEAWITLKSRLSGSNTIAVNTTGTGVRLREIMDHNAASAGGSVSRYSLQGKRIGDASRLTGLSVQVSKSAAGETQRIVSFPSK